MAYKICPECGGKVAQTRTVCIHCGYDFESLFRYCQECGHRVSDGEDECPECGSFELGEIMHDEGNSIEEHHEFVEEENEVKGIEIFQPFTLDEIIAKETFILPDEAEFTMIEVVMVKKGLYVILRSKEIKYREFQVLCGDVFERYPFSIEKIYRKQCNSLEYVFVDKKISTNISNARNEIRLKFDGNLPVFVYDVDNNLLNLM